MKYLCCGFFIFLRRYLLVYSDLFEMIEVGLIWKKFKKEVVLCSMYVNFK